LEDALDEPEGCVTVAFVLPRREELAEACCMAVPVPDAGCARLQDTHIIFRVTPRDGGCRLVMAIRGRLAGAVLGALEHVPAFVVRMAAASKAKEIAAALARHAASSSELACRMRDSPRGELYAQLGRRLASPRHCILPAVAGLVGAIDIENALLRDKLTPVTMTPVASSDCSPSERCRSSGSEDIILCAPGRIQSSNQGWSVCDAVTDYAPWQVFSQELPEEWAD